MVVYFAAPQDAPLPTIGESLAELYGPANPGAANHDPAVPSTSAGRVEDTTPNSVENEAIADRATEQAEDVQKPKPKTLKGKRAKRPRPSKK